MNNFKETLRKIISEDPRSVNNRVLTTRFVIVWRTHKTQFTSYSERKQFKNLQEAINEFFQEVIERSSTLKYEIFVITKFEEEQDYNWLNPETYRICDLNLSRRSYYDCCECE